MNNKILFLWGLIVACLLGAILLLGYNKQDKVYLRYTKELKNASQKYIEDNNLNTKDTQIIFVKDLIEKDYIEYNSEYMGYCIHSIAVSKELFTNKYEIIRDCTVIDELEQKEEEK